VPRLYAAEANDISAERAHPNQRSRWGSCAPSGAIALNFRLVQMPPDVRDYVLIRVDAPASQNHSRRFWRLVEAVCPHFRDAERWPKTYG
jgi:predicted metal-dependent hydrolase